MAKLTKEHRELIIELRDALVLARKTMVVQAMLNGSGDIASSPFIYEFDLAINNATFALTEER